MRRILASLVLALLCFVGVGGDSPAQGGFSKEKFPEHGLSFELAKRFEWLAIQPNEEWVVLQWVYEDSRRSKDREKEKRRSRRSSTFDPKLQVLRIDYVGDPGPSSPGGMGPSDDAPARGADGEDDEEEEAPPLPINSWRRYAEQRLENWEPLEVGRGRERDGYDATEYELRVKKGKSSYRGWAYVWEDVSRRTFVVLGWARSDEYEDMLDIWRKTAESMRFSEPKPDPDIVKWQRFYARRPKFKAPDYRIRVRKGLQGDWEAEDTENYIVIYNTKDQPLVRRILRDLESIRKEYLKLFPPAGEMTAVSTVRVCADRDEYMAYGGPGGSAGYWNWVTEELVLYDGTKREKGKKTDKLDTFIVLYHEAFHQYIHYSAGELSPHSWFNEGYGDFFSGALVKGGKVKKIAPNRWRVATIKKAVEQRKFTHWRDIIEYEQPQYYNPAKVGINYAQGWSMIYFLNTSKKAKRKWSGILPVYFETLKSTWKEELAKLEAKDEAEDDEKRYEGQLAARKAAVKAAFEGVDLDEIEEEWVSFVEELEP